jgi:hypothetical protein
LCLCTGFAETALFVEILGRLIQCGWILRAGRRKNGSR